MKFNFQNRLNSMVNNHTLYVAKYITENTFIAQA